MLKYGVLRCRAAKRVREALDHAIVGQDELKHGVILGLVSREHVFVEGPPGCGKTFTAEVAAAASGLSSYFYQFHRDTRVAELIGSTVIHRETATEPSGVASGVSERAPQMEVLRTRNVPGGVLTSEVAVLDDITRAPGEALNVLLRVLCERKYQATALPLVSAIATANPAGEMYYTDPIDPATLDRFAIQLQVDGLVGQRDWASVDTVLKSGRTNSNSTLPPTADHHRPPAELEAAQAAARTATVPLRVQRMLVRLMQVLCTEYPEVAGDDSALSDRSFLVKSLTLMRAQAHVLGRMTVAPEDLHVLALLTTFRLPPEVHAQIANIIQRVIDEETDEEQSPPPPPPQLDEQQAKEDEDDSPEDDDGGGGGDGDGDDEQENDDNEDDDPGGSSGSDGDQDDESDSARGPPPSTDNPDEHNGDGPSSAADVPSDASGSQSSESSLPSVGSIVDKVRGDDTGDGTTVDGEELTEVENVGAVLRVLKGRFQRGKAQATPHRGGQPRSYHRPDDFDEFDDCDPIESLEWLRNPTPQLPRRLARHRTDRCGSLALLRDTSMSMTGVWTQWAQSLSLQIVSLGHEQSMRIGYMEFNHLLKKTVDENDGFFHQDYGLHQHEVNAARCSGVTNYQLPLSHALEEFRKSGSRKLDRHIVFLTDGLPTSGCKVLAEETERAIELGVSVHTLFIGSKPYPEILERLSMSTHGAQFRACYDQVQRSIIVTQRRPGDL